MRSIRDLELVEPEGVDLPAIDLTGSDSAGGSAALDPRAFEERYARLGFGLGTVPRRQRRDDPWWETSLGMVAVVIGVLLLLWLSTGG